MTFSYVVPIQPRPSREELEWAWKFTVFARADGRCQHCGKQTRLDACHIEARHINPAREFDPDNGVALCRSCHMQFDHKVKARPSGRPVGYRMPAEFRERMREVGKRRAQTPGFAEEARQRALAMWDRQGRKHHPRPCEHCGAMITGHKSSTGARFCSAACHYAFRKGKPRSGY